MEFPKAADIKLNNKQKQIAFFILSPTKNILFTGKRILHKGKTQNGFLGKMQNHNDEMHKNEI